MDETKRAFLCRDGFLSVNLVGNGFGDGGMVTCRV